LVFSNLRGGAGCVRFFSIKMNQNIRLASEHAIAHGVGLTGDKL